MTKTIHLVEADLRPSNAHRWMKCAGQPLATHGLPDAPSKYAERGTVAHALLELALRLDYNEEDLNYFYGKEIKGKDVPVGIPVDEEMIRGVGHAVDYVRSYMTLHPLAEFHIECYVTIQLGAYQTDGTSDVIIDNLPEELVVMDYKNGVNYVDEEENPQLTLYAIGYLQQEAARVKPKTKVKLVIVQPNAKGGEPPVREHLVDPAFLLYFTEQASAAAGAANETFPPRTAGDHCRFCRAAGTCTTYAEWIMAQAGLDFQAEELEMPTAQDMKPKDVAKVLRSIELLRAWIVSVEEAAIACMLEGGKIPGYKLVGSRPQRRWDDNAKVLQLIIRQKLDLNIFAPRIPLTPAALEKTTKGKKAILRQQTYNRFIPRVTHNPVEPRIAPVSDRRKLFVPGQEFLE